jgi:hypothetical protein
MPYVKHCNKPWKIETEIVLTDNPASEESECPTLIVCHFAQYQQLAAIDEQKVERSLSAKGLEKLVRMIEPGQNYRSRSVIVDRKR